MLNEVKRSGSLAVEKPLDLSGGLMKDRHNSDDTEMRDEYDFSKGVRGKHYRQYRQGHTVRIRKTDGTVSVQYFTQEEGAVMLDPDVKECFPDSESVNRALRSLMVRDKKG
jgi:hypothetical protein